MIKFFSGVEDLGDDVVVYGKESVHDYSISGYRVDMQKGYIELDVINGDDSRNAIKKKITFMGVIGHRFEHEMAQSIILDIEEVGIRRFIERNSGVLIEGLAYGWPIDVRSIEALEKKLNKMRKRCFEINASSGLNGWVIADDYKVI